MNLIPVINQIRSDVLKLRHERDEKVKEINSQYNAKIDELAVALAVNSDMNTTCLACEGEGVTSKSEYHERIYKKCGACGGTGKKND